MPQAWVEFDNQHEVSWQRTAAAAAAAKLLQ